MPKEHDYIYIVLSEIISPMENISEKLSSSSSSSSSSTLSTQDNKETELRLGLPGSERNPPMHHSSWLSLFGKPIDTLTKNFVSGSNKRGFSDAINEWVNGSVLCSPVADNGNMQNSSSHINNSAPPAAAKEQVVGWPPIRSFRKKTMASKLAKTNEEVEGKPGFGCRYVKVSMDGAPYLRKIDLGTYTNYVQLSSALEKMFSCFTIGQCSCHGLSEARLKDLLHGSENVLTYEDKDGDWMLVGDVPWEMFTDTCKRLRIMKGSEAIGLTPKAMEKCKSHKFKLCPCA